MSFINSINDFLWTYIVITLLVGCALYFTFKTKGVQFRMIGEMFRIMMGRDRKSQKGGSIGSFKAFSVSLASRVGTGNLAGVASAIFVGGPGAVFWMWVMALFGAATGFVESTLAQLFKKKGKRSYYGGPAYYMEAGLKKKWMGVLFSVLMVLTFGFANNLLQSNVIADSLNATFGFDKLIVSSVVMVVLMVIVIGGVHRVSTVTSYMVPIMAMAYLVLAVVIIGMNITRIPEVFRLIIDGAFGIRQVGGGVVGVAIMQGVKRGLFSNEAGEGSAPNAAAIADTSHPAKQGLVQALGVFVDTIVICTCTAMIVLISGEFNGDSDGIVLTINALEALIGPVGKYFVTLAVLLFAFTTLIANYFYGENNILFITDNKAVIWTYRVIAAVLVVLGALYSLQEVWAWVDIAMGLLTICNLVALIFLAKYAFFLINDYCRQKKEGKEPEFHRSQMPEIEKDIDAWD